MSVLLLLRPELGADVPFLAQIAFGSDPGDPASSRVWSDVSDRLRRVVIRRGALRELDRVEAASATGLFDDADGALDPSNASSPYAPNLLPLRPIRYLSHRAGVTYPRFTGFVVSFPPRWQQPSYGELELEAVDGFELLATAQLVSGRASLETALAGSNNDLVFTARDEGGQGDEITIEYVVAGTDTPLSVGTNQPLQGEATVRGELDDVGSGPGWWIAAGARRKPVTVTVQGTQVTAHIATNSAGAPTSTASQVKAALEADAEVAKLITVALAPGNSGAGVVTAMAKTNLAGGKFPAELSGARINRLLDLAGWPTADRLIDTGTITVVAKGFARTENASVLQHLQEVADSELGKFFVDGAGHAVFHDRSHRATAARSTASQATFSNDGVGFDWEDVELSYGRDQIVNEATITAEGGEPQTASDGASQTRYRRRSIARSTLANADADALDMAEAIVAALKEPLVRFDAVHTAAFTEDPSFEQKLAAMLGLEIADRITVRVAPSTHDTVTAYDVFVEQIEDTWQVPVEHVLVKLQVSPTGQSTSEENPGGGGGGALKDSSGDDFVLDSGTAGILG